MSIKSSPDYKKTTWNTNIFFLPLLKLVSKILCHVFIVIEKKKVCIPRSFLVINVRNQGKTLCSPCITVGRST